MGKAPNGLANLKQQVSEYFSNPEKFIDFSTRKNCEEEYDSELGAYVHNRISFRVKTLEQVTGLVKLGRGCYSDVYAIDDTRVLKIVKDKDTGYARFVDQCRKYPSNPHFPDIHYSGEWGGKTVYILERLNSAPTNGDYSTNEYFRSALRAANNPFITHVSKHIAEIARVLEDEGLTGDLHRGNVMFRDDVPVVTDPQAD